MRTSPSPSSSAVGHDLFRGTLTRSLKAPEAWYGSSRASRSRYSAARCENDMCGFPARGLGRQDHALAGGSSRRPRAGRQRALGHALPQRAPPCADGRFAIVCIVCVMLVAAAWTRHWLGEAAWRDTRSVVYSGRAQPHGRARSINAVHGVQART